MPQVPQEPNLQRGSIVCAYKAYKLAALDKQIKRTKAENKATQMHVCVPVSVWVWVWVWKKV